MALIRVRDDPVRDMVVSLLETALYEETPMGGKKRGLLVAGVRSRIIPFMTPGNSGEKWRSPSIYPSVPSHRAPASGPPCNRQMYGTVPPPVHEGTSP